MEERDRVLRATLQPGEVEQLTTLLACVRKGAHGLALEEERFEKSMSPPSAQQAA
jgi:hypothetical protein